MQAILEESVTEGELEQEENCIFFTELRVLTQFMDEASVMRSVTKVALCLWLWIE